MRNHQALFRWSRTLRLLPIRITLLGWLAHECVDRDKSEQHEQDGKRDARRLCTLESLGTGHDAPLGGKQDEPVAEVPGSGNHAHHVSG